MGAKTWPSSIKNTVRDRIREAPSSDPEARRDRVTPLRCEPHNSAKANKALALPAFHSFANIKRLRLHAVNRYSPSGFMGPLKSREADELLGQRTPSGC